MLAQLEIRNIALIDRVNIELGKGLNILTGETGAGKSIIIDSINAILGERFSKDLIRTGREKARVEAVFYVDYDRVKDILDEIGIEPEEDSALIISREFNATGKNICRLNGRIVTVSVLKRIGERIIDVHGQYDNQSLLRTQSHIELLDSFGGSCIDSLKKQYIKYLKEYKDTKNKLKKLFGDKKERERKIDLLRFQIEEIKKAKLKVGEEEELNKQRMLLSNSEKITAALTKSYELLYSGKDMRDSAFDNISQALTELGDIAEIDEKFSDILKRLEDVSYQLEDISHELRKENDKVEFDPNILEQIEERIDLIFNLKRKFGNSIKEILDYCENIENELEEMLNNEENIKRLNAKLLEIENNLYKAAREINKERVKAASVLENEIGKEFQDLEMKKARFKVSIEFDDVKSEQGERRYLENGLDKVEFLISPNAGEPLKPLSKIASGGEMSRIMLAIKNILADVDKIPTLIFDEIDAGVSGKAAQKVGEKLACIAKSHQVICVTHLAQIASMADNHFLIEKVTENDETRTLVKKLKGTEVKDEIARILGGAEISDITRKHAEEMINNAQRFKS